MGDFVYTLGLKRLLCVSYFRAFSYSTILSTRSLHCETFHSQISLNSNSKLASNQSLVLDITTAIYVRPYKDMIDSS